MQEVGVSAATDVTGFGFLGHLSEMLEPSGVGAVVRRSETPIWERAAALGDDGCIAGGLTANREYLGDRISLDGVAPEAALPLYDPQTSGGLLIAVAPDRASSLMAALERHATPGFVVGEVVEGSGVRIVP